MDEFPIQSLSPPHPLAFSKAKRPAGRAGLDVVPAGYGVQPKISPNVLPVTLVTKFAGTT